MSRYIMIRRLRLPAYLLLVGALALLDEGHIMSWGKSWPFFLILAGVIALAERAALASEGGYPQPPYPGAPNPRSATGIPPYPGQPTATVPAQSPDSGNEHQGGQS